MDFFGPAEAYHTSANVEFDALLRSDPLFSGINIHHGAYLKGE